MAFKGNNAYLKKVVFDWSMVPDMGSQNAISVLACAILCIRQDCSTVNTLLDEASLVCLMSKKKGTCMEKEEVFRNPGAKMYQKTVI
jgi:hypothetical protein